MSVKNIINWDAQKEIDVQLNIVKYDICEGVSKQFNSDTDSMTSELTATIRKNTSLAWLFASCEVVQDQVWVPCEYSVNTVNGVRYWTTNITPEHGSYASLGTMLPTDPMRLLSLGYWTSSSQRSAF